ncbi:DNA repair protein recA-like 3, mitochondrial [Glycine soja]|uniref:DNA repair protein recA-like 3, mitochondrial n=1 Tax=Glycine soja TaxID=3848 RepID=A0A445HE02_GLYSO|nr:DNA repair protein recA-like 3, mitochondrial [Glycine soja]
MEERSELGKSGRELGLKNGFELDNIFHFYIPKGRRRSKSDGSDSGEENMSKKELALQQALDQITSAFGNGSIMWLGRSVSPKSLPVVSTGSFALDVALGHVVEIYGPEASVKTTLALHVIAEAQKQGGYCVFVDAEHALDKKLAESIGVNTTNLLLSQPDCGEQALSLVDTLIRSGSVDVIVVDSVAALVPKGELDGEMGHAHMAMQARLMSQALRKLSHALSPSQCILIFINQVRSNISTFGGFSGPTELLVVILGSQVLVKVVKNKLVPPFKIAEFELQFGKGISKETEIIDLSVKNKLISKAGAMFYYNEQSFRGKDALKNFLAENQSALEELEMKLREKLLNAETEKMWDVINGDVREAIATVDSTDEEAAAIVEA